ncbi:uncharacterized protein BX664DRAFT_169766 [Halteromyces radiatus]|uniref:uncharacterized protein n=1 Tax=Halteromyces radiatus TaxID=101107 RepID=UPI00221F81DC|nr:uncharacterized protein BX664DRAFT_169766 [Halteromyces radiatus]KAI8084627.1 hypothetical protein BX664DRAFT_169766 [Halteromyces radiatus]
MLCCTDEIPHDKTEEEPILSRTIAFLYSVMDRTVMHHPSASVCDAIKLYCMNKSSIPVVCPATTMICALYYLQRFKQKFNIFSYSYQVGQRLVLVAYLVAAKYIHANLKSTVTYESSLSHPSNKNNNRQRPLHHPRVIPWELSWNSSSLSSTSEKLQSSYSSDQPMPPTIANIITPDNPSSSSSSSTSYHDTNSDNKNNEDERASEEDAAQLLGKMGPSWSINLSTAQLCLMEMEFLYFLDYQLELGPSSPLQLWSWLDSILDSYCHRYHVTLKNNMQAKLTNKSKTSTVS